MSQETILLEIIRERRRQHERWGQQDLLDGTGLKEDRELAEQVRSQTTAKLAAETVTYRDIFLEEVFEACAEHDQERLREELIQALAVGVQWIEKLDREAGRR